jgi:uncharacterized Zn-finger protein
MPRPALPRNLEYFHRHGPSRPAGQGGQTGRPVRARGPQCSTSNHVCAECGKKFISKFNLKSHSATVHNAYGKQFKCPFCPKTFALKMRLSTHFLSHTTEKAYPCSKYGVEFARTSHRKRHELLSEHRLPCSN